MTVAADLGFRSDASAAVAIRVELSSDKKSRRFTLLDWLELRPHGGPLTPSDVCHRIARLALSVDCRSVWSDFHYSESARELLRGHGVALELGPGGATGKTEVWTTARSLVHSGAVSVPDLPVLLEQLKSVRHKPTTAGGISITQPRRGNSHGDLAAAFALALWVAATQITIGPMSYRSVPRERDVSPIFGGAPSRRISSHRRGGTWQSWTNLREWSREWD